jgi:hypothetical protein
MIGKSNKISSETGGIRDISLNLIKSSLSESKASGRATLCLQVLGERQNRDVTVNLQKRDGAWSVVSAAMGGEQLR